MGRAVTLNSAPVTLNSGPVTQRYRSRKLGTRKRGPPGCWAGPMLQDWHPPTHRVCVRTGCTHIPLCVGVCALCVWVPLLLCVASTHSNGMPIVCSGGNCVVVALAIRRNHHRGVSALPAYVFICARHVLITHDELYFVLNLFSFCFVVRVLLHRGYVVTRYLCVVATTTALSGRPRPPRSGRLG